jgi:hypothetical protein
VKSKKKQQQQQQQIQITQESCNTTEQQNEIIVDSKKHLQIQQEAKTLTEQYSENNNENKSNNVFSDSMMSKGNDSGSDGSQMQCIRFNSFQQHQWHTLLDHNHQEL